MIGDESFDVVVLGGGISGAMAACAASRAGARTLLAERSGCLGGTLVGCGVGPMMTFHCGKEQIVRGLPGELIDRLAAKGLSSGHVADTSGYTYSVTPFDAEGLKQELEIMNAQAGTKLLFGALCVGAERKGDRLESVKVATKAGLIDLRGSVFVDATGDADLASRAGFPCAVPPSMQPATMVFRMAGADLAATRAYVAAHPEEFPRIAEGRQSLDAAAQLSLSGFFSEMRDAKASGAISVVREDLLFFETSNPGEVIVNTSRVFVRDPLDPEDLSRMAVEGRKQVRELAAFIKARIPGFAGARLTWSGPEIGIRNSRQIVGEHVYTEQDILSLRTFPDAIAHSAYPIDIHNAGDGGTTSTFLPENKFYSIPYRSLIPKGAVNLLAAGRCLSVTFAAQAAVRVSPTMGAVGQAAGVAAALSSKNDSPVGRVDPAELRAALRAQGAWLPEEIA